jgi:hypothetical protein
MKEHRYGAGALEKDDRDSQTELGFDNPNASFASSSPDQSPKFPIQLNDHWQVDYDPLQWILYRWWAGRWYPRAFCCTASGLQLRVRELVGPIDKAASVTLQSLPPFHPDREVRP